MDQRLYEALQRNPIIAAVRDDGGFSALVRRKQRRAGSEQAVRNVNVIPAFGCVGGHRDDGHGASSLSSQKNGL